MCNNKLVCTVHLWSKFYKLLEEGTQREVSIISWIGLTRVLDGELCDIVHFASRECNSINNQDMFDFFMPIEPRKRSWVRSPPFVPLWTQDLLKEWQGPCAILYILYTVRVVHLHIWSKWCSNIDCMVVQYRIQINTSILWRGPKISVKYQFNLCMIWRENPPMKYCEKYAKICTNKSVFSQPLQYCICSHNIKFFLYTVPKITWIFACHGWSRCIGICWFMGQLFVYKCQT